MKENMSDEEPKTQHIDENLGTLSGENTFSESQATVKTENPSGAQVYKAIEETGPIYANYMVSSEVTHQVCEMGIAGAENKNNIENFDNQAGIADDENCCPNASSSIQNPCDN